VCEREIEKGRERKKKRERKKERERERERETARKRERQSAKGLRCGHFPPLIPMNFYF